jgi:hypothetical protein
VPQDLPVLSFTDATELRGWLEGNHQTSAGTWVRIYKKNSSVTFEDILDEGLCFGWSERKRDQGDQGDQGDQCVQGVQGATSCRTSSSSSPGAPGELRPGATASTRGGSAGSSA